jgi:hypothetical protein
VTSCAATAPLPDALGPGAPPLPGASTELIEAARAFWRAHAKDDVTVMLRREEQLIRLVEAEATRTPQLRLLLDAVHAFSPGALEPEPYRVHHAGDAFGAPLRTESN